MESKTLAMIKICLLSIIAIALILIFIVLLYRPNGFGFFSLGSREASKLIFDETYDEDINSLYVSAVAGYVEINESNDNNVSVKIYGRDDDDINVNVVDNKLSVVEDNRYFCIGFCINTEYRIIINVPKDREYDIELKTTSGDVDVSNINVINANVKTVSGDILISSVKVVDVKTVSGEIDIDSINSKCKIKTTSGDVEIGRLNITSDSTINTISGEVNINYNNSYIKTNTVSGDVDVKNNDRYAKVETSISTTSGDITVGD